MLRGYIYNRRLVYIVFALGFGFVWYLFKVGGNPQPLRALFSTLIDVFFSLSACIITVELLLPRLFYKQRTRVFVLCLLLIIALAGSLTILAQVRLMGFSIGEYYQKNTVYYKPHFYYWFWSDLVLGSYFLIAFITLVGFAIRLAFDRVITAGKMERLEKERTMAELEMLKNQINPHFLFNALNTIYYKIDRVNHPARLMVENFSSLLRYQLYECEAAEVGIEKELKFITDYIALQRDRLSQYAGICCQGLREMEGFNIAPFILMPLVENCFKHVSQYKNKENTITICCERSKDDWFFFKTVNSVEPVTEAQETGIGLDNVKKRLELIYPNRHLLVTEPKNHFFNLTLGIKIR